MTTMLTLGQAARHCRVSKGTISKAISSGKLSATRREDGSWAIDGAELARYVEANGHRFRAETVQSRAETDFGEQLATVADLRARAELAEARLADLKTMLDDMRHQRDRWETVATRLSLSAPKPEEKPAATPASLPALADPGAPEPSRLRRAWRWLRATG
jgi:hypothetical protein